MPDLVSITIPQEIIRIINAIIIIIIIINSNEVDNGDDDDG